PLIRPQRPDLGQHPVHRRQSLRRRVFRTTGAPAGTRTADVRGTAPPAAAGAAARATAAVNGVADRVTVLRDDAMAGVAGHSADLVLCNPPFHVGAAVHTGSAIKMFSETGRVLRPGGELWTVYNSHLNYRGVMERLVGKTDVVGRNRKFTVTRSVRGLYDVRQE
ncbi:class I SAM-dependent methyltransferase, partial [Nocardia wallacei]|uniref:class I SAM-dependent methyltransferase n=1 Tax=Nocardia wallacei TaxID=480035 RepID=UPI00245670B7